MLVTAVVRQFELSSFRLILAYLARYGNALVWRGSGELREPFLLCLTEHLICAQIQCTMRRDDMRAPLRAARSERAQIDRLSPLTENNLQFNVIHS
jgi:hypothetical protein